MGGARVPPGQDSLLAGAAKVASLRDLARVLRQLRRREARQRGDTEWTYRELAAKTGWSVGAIGEYFAGTVLAPTDRFDAMVRLLGANEAEQGALATARDRVADRRRDSAKDSRPTGGAVPRQLPPAAPGFVGRRDALMDLDAAVATRTRGVAPVIITISGAPGIGKTALAVHWAHLAADRFPDGQLYVDLQGFATTGRPLTWPEVIRRFLAALHSPAEGVPADPAAQVALYRTLLAGRRVLLVLDNARDAEQVRPLLPGEPGCVSVVTSRNRLTGLVASQGAQPITLATLTASEALELLAHRLGQGRISAEPRAAEEIIARCARLPLALAIVAARAATHPQLRLRQLAEGLRDSRECLNALAVDDPSVDVCAVFSWSFRALSASAARLFRLLSLHPGPEITVAAAASLGGCPPARAEALLAELSGTHLVLDRGSGRYGLHDLLRAYASEQARAYDNADLRDATRRMFDHYLHSAHACARLLHPTLELTEPDPPCPKTVPEVPADRRTALAWFLAEQDVLVALVGSAAGTGWHAYAWRLAASLADFLERRGDWQDQLAIGRAALAAAQPAGDLRAQARAHRVLARANLRLRRYDEAYGHLRNALDLDLLTSDVAGQAHTNLCMGMVWKERGGYREALESAREALALFQAADHDAGQAHAFNAVGLLSAQLGDHETALDYCQRALVAHQRIGNRYGQANAWACLGVANRQLRRPTQAIVCFQQALGLRREMGSRYQEADTLTTSAMPISTRVTAERPGGRGATRRPSWAIFTAGKRRRRSATRSRWSRSRLRNRMPPRDVKPRSCSATDLVAGGPLPGGQRAGCASTRCTPRPLIDIGYLCRCRARR